MPPDGGGWSPGVSIFEVEVVVGRGSSGFSSVFQQARLVYRQCGLPENGALERGISSSREQCNHRESVGMLRFVWIENGNGTRGICKDANSARGCVVR